MGKGGRQPHHGEYYCARLRQGGQTVEGYGVNVSSAEAHVRNLARRHGVEEEGADVTVTLVYGRMPRALRGGG